jgi:hypothetical protein
MRNDSHPWRKSIRLKARKKQCTVIPIEDLKVGDIVSTVTPRGRGRIEHIIQVDSSHFKLNVLVTFGREKGDRFTQTMHIDENVEVFNVVSEEKQARSEH